MKKRNRFPPALLLAVLVFFPAASSPAQEAPVPVGLQFQILFKALFFDRNLKSRAGDEAVIGIIYQSRNRDSLNVRDAFSQAARDSSEKDIDGLPFRVVSIDLDNGIPLEKALSNDRVVILYVAPLRAIKVRTISAISLSRKILTLTGMPDYSKSDIAVSVDSLGGKPQLIINLRVAKAVGCDFSSRLLKLATVIQ